MKYAIGPEAYALMLADSIDSIDSLTATQVAQYADFYFEYGSQRRATLERVDGGSRTFSFAYTTSSNADGPNNWTVKTAESRPALAEASEASQFTGASDRMSDQSER